MKIFKLASLQLLILVTSMAISIALQAEMSGKNHKKQQMKMTMKDSLMVMNGWVRLMPPSAKNTAAYFILHNTTDKDVTIVGVSSKVAKMTMMHDVVIENSMAKMIHLDKVTVPAGAQVEFAPSGKHVMIVGLFKKLEADSDVKLMFKLDSGEMITSIMKVKATANSLPGEHKH